jgi:glycosyltransferase involved in cell wall biosynthesis
MSSTESTIASQKVAAIISTYNRYDMCLEAIRSALDQTHRNMHVIVVDDCSKDPRYASIESVISDARFKYIRLDKNTKDLLGSTQPAYVRNVGIKATDADFVAILDDDDMWLPDKIEKQLKAMYRFNHFVCCTDIYFYPTRWDNMYRNHMGEEVWRRSWSKDLFGGMKKLDAKHYLMPRKKLDE